MLANSSHFPWSNFQNTSTLSPTGHHPSFGWRGLAIWNSLLKCIEEVYPSRVMRTKDGKVIKTTVGVLPDAICREFVPQTELHDCVQMVSIVLKKRGAGCSPRCGLYTHRQVERGVGRKNSSQVAL